MIVRTIQYPRLKTTNKVNIQSDYKLQQIKQNTYVNIKQTKDKD